MTQENAKPPVLTQDQLARRQEAVEAIWKRNLCLKIGNRLPKDDRYGQWLRGEG